MDSVLEKKYRLVKKAFGSFSFFNVEDAQEILKTKKSTLYWDLSKMVEYGYLKRIGKGRYSVNDVQNEQPSYSVFAGRIINILEETGFRFYISGIDILIKYMQHIPDNYPVMLYVDKYSKDEVLSLFDNHRIHYIEGESSNKNSIFTNSNTSDNIVVIYTTTNFEYTSDGFATRERAFVDLYNAVTRSNYPVSVQEIARIYVNLTSLGALDKKLLIKIASIKSLHHDIRFIVESKHINIAAFKIVEIIRSGV
ncbi:MAG: hypothetical protein FIA99_03605 [Ruminiclostridium sp.]|nr:hypothetical protein [Ruminiclostridium sp.]